MRRSPQSTAIGQRPKTKTGQKAQPASLVRTASLREKQMTSYSMPALRMNLATREQK